MTQVRGFGPPLRGWGQRVGLVGLESVLRVLRKCLLGHRLDVLGHLLVLWVEPESVFRLRTDALGLRENDWPYRTNVLEPRIVLRGR
jgi:hypothetical protein